MLIFLGANFPGAQFMLLHFSMMLTSIFLWNTGPPMYSFQSRDTRRQPSWSWVISMVIDNIVLSRDGWAPFFSAGWGQASATRPNGLIGQYPFCIFLMISASRTVSETLLCIDHLPIKYPKSNFSPTVIYFARSSLRSYHWLLLTYPAPAAALLIFQIQYNAYHKHKPLKTLNKFAMIAVGCSFSLSKWYQ